jgi:hypothetical protein
MVNGDEAEGAWRCDRYFTNLQSVLPKKINQL